MDTNTRVSIGLGVLAAIFAAATILSVKGCWVQKDKRKDAEKALQTAKATHRADSMELAKVYEGLRKCEAQPRVTVQAGRRNKITNK